MTPSSPDPADPYRCVIVDVEGARADQLIDEAIRQAALFLREQPADLYGAEVGSAYPVERSRFRRHLGEQGHVLRYRATVKVRLLPDIVRARRNDQPDPPRPSPGRRHLRPAT